ncbi:MAG: DegV family protein [Archangium sp.]|nr:DegV family protein [Archangium sp.]
MRIVTNPGSNLDEDLTLALDVDLVPQKIIVDGISRDTRGTIDFAQVDDWVKKALKHPHVQGTTEAEFVDYFGNLIKKDPELLVVMTSRKLIGSHDAAVAASKKIAGAKIEVVDSLVTDVGAGLATLAAVQARAAGLELAKTAAFVRKFVARGRNAFQVATLDNLIKGGRVGAVQAFVANFLNIRPILSVDDGLVTSVAKTSAKADPAEKLTEYLTQKMDAKQPVWIAVSHGRAPEVAERVATRLKEAFPKHEYALVRPLSPSIYLHLGPGAVTAWVYPLDGLDLRLKAPSPSGRGLG